MKFVGKFLDERLSWKEKCALVGVFNAPNAAFLSYYALFSMQHRGQEASGISVSNHKRLLTAKNHGLVTEVFSSCYLKRLEGFASIGHNRYSTAGKESNNDAQPLFAHAKEDFALAHNGNLTNAEVLRKKLIEEGIAFQSHLDTEVLIPLITQSQKPTIEERVIDALKQVKGAYALVLLFKNKLIAIRDAYGLRPLSLGSLENKDGSKAYIVASETCAFDLIGAKYEREINPGEMLVFELDQQQARLTSKQIFEPKNRPCVFEWIYFARPDSLVFSQNAYIMRQNLGKQLAKEHKIKADMIVPVPDSGMPYALGYAKESAIDLEFALVRNNYIGRTFIEPKEENRELKVKLKLNPINAVIKDKEIIVIDDSLVRGTTSKQIVKILRNAGAKKVHFLIGSPPIIAPCFYGIDTPNAQDLIGFNRSIEEVCAYIQADSLGFLSLEGLQKSIQAPFCQSCFDGKYLKGLE
ncbi:amidophosphoribosyltransferase [Helicobacter cetorum]|uniref:amidophosphoribosyltransferase n=1 Tax=Helicobacter cetorum TaxID=138563 RepID=UPI000CF1344B|nr:amidophosphoribosyltransferase [Helicobacter cetorum]